VKIEKQEKTNRKGRLRLGGSKKNDCSREKKSMRLIPAGMTHFKRAVRRKPGKSIE